jgi:hypothetical protein
VEIFENILRKQRSKALEPSSLDLEGLLLQAIK